MSSSGMAGAALAPSPGEYRPPVPHARPARWACRRPLTQPTPLVYLFTMPLIQTRNALTVLITVLPPGSARAA